MVNSANFFKSYTRQSRVQKPEENFMMGMHFTSQPLSDGFVKTLVNYNIHNKGEVLRPRLGLRTTELSLYPAQLDTAPITHTPEMLLATGKDVTIFGDKIYKQLILGQPSENQIAGTTLYSGNAFVGTGYPQGNALNPAALHADIDTRALHYEALGSTTFKRPMEGELHGLPFTNLDYIARHIGTFAFNNAYYYCGPSKLRKTKIDDTDETAAKFITEDVVPKELSPKEAVLWGYNMLDTNPYDFDNTANAGIIQLLGLLPYDKQGKLLMTPRVNEEIILKAFYAAPPASYELHWEWKEPQADVWNTIQKYTADLAPLPTTAIEFSTPLQDVMIRMTATKSGDTMPEKILTVGFSFNQEQHGSTANVSAINYAIPKASGFVYWRNRLVAYGLAEDPTVLLVSDVNDPSYFPYPHNADLFEEPIVHAISFLDDLLVFTSSQLHLLSLDPSGTYWHKQLLQNNLDIKEWDIHLIKAVKNMVFFKSGNYYYMVVPKATGVGGLAIAPISRNIEGFLDDFKLNVDDIFKTVYGRSLDVQLVHGFNYLDFEDIHNVYVFRDLTSELFINLTLLYSTLERTWRIHIYESQHVVMPYKQDATKKGTLMSLVPITQTWKDAGAVEYVTSTPCIQFLKYTKTLLSDFYVPRDIQVNPYGVTNDPFGVFDTLHEFKNHQFLDTGYRDIMSDYKKRFREIQIKFNNTSEKVLRFNHEAIIDGQSRHDIYAYTTTHDTDPNSPNYGLITVIQDLVDPTLLPKKLIVPGTTVLAASEQADGSWALDTSYFPELAFHKVRFPVSGKGYTPRLKLVSYNEEAYEILNTIWVFRPLYSR